jgi:hypothetical protein
VTRVWKEGEVRTVLQDGKVPRVLLNNVTNLILLSSTVIKMAKMVNFVLLLPQ